VFLSRPAETNHCVSLLKMPVGVDAAAPEWRVGLIGAYPRELAAAPW
jgi:hypothetical protein